MSELEIYHCDEWHNTHTEFYLKHEADREIAHQKRKRCLALADYAEAESCYHTTLANGFWLLRNDMTKEKDLVQTLHDRMRQRIKWQAGLIDETIETRKNKGTYKGEFTTAVILANAYNDIFENQYKDFDVKEGDSK